MDLFTSKNWVVNGSKRGSKVWVWGMALVVVSMLVLGGQAQAGLIVYIDDASTAGIDVVIADGKKANETIEWVTSDKQLASLKTTLSDSDVSSADGMIGLTVEKDGGTWALLKSFLPNFSFDPGFSAVETTDAVTGAEGLAMKMLVSAEKMKGEGPGKLQVWASRSFKSPFDSGVLSIDASGLVSESVRNSSILFTGAFDPNGNEFGTTYGVSGSPTFGGKAEGQFGFEFSKYAGVTLKSSSLLSMTTGLSIVLNPGDYIQTGLQMHAVVPEPASILVWTVAGGAMFFWRKRRGLPPLDC